ncbi:TonB-dependent siderophore receptor [Thalassospira sp.]|uniref:TonB-dependent siderophore receptor n=1 Tax=Thalassospira sp. TaxID=1912094 RepID=UPI003AA87B48
MMNVKNLPARDAVKQNSELRRGDTRNTWMRRLVATTLVSGATMLSPWQVNAANIAVQNPPKAEVAQSTKVRLDIPAQELDRALTSFADQANLKLLFPSDDLGELRAPALLGEMSVDAALTMLLRGSGFTWRYTDSGTVTIEKLSVDGENVLDPVRVTAALAKDGNAPLDSYVAKVSSAATKTSTSILETQQTVSVVGRQEMDDRGVHTVTDVLRYTPGILGDIYGTDPRGHDRVTMRGFTNYDNGDFRDGLRTTSSGFAVYATEPYGLERVDVMKGPSSTLYGQSEAGGIVNRVSKRPSSDQKQEIRLEFGEWDHFQGAFDIGGAANADKSLLFRAVGVVRNASGEYDFANGEEADNDRIYFAPSLTAQINDDTKLTLLAEYMHEDRGTSYRFVDLNGNYYDFLSGDPDLDEFTRDQVSFGTEFEHRINKTWTFRQNTRYTYIDTYEIGLFPVGLTGSTLSRYASEGDNEIGGFVLDNQFEAGFATGGIDHTLLLGVDGEYEVNDYKYGYDYGVTSLDVSNPVITQSSYDPTYSSSQNYEQTTYQYGIYAQDQMNLGDHWVVTLGGRYSKVDSETEYADGSSLDQNDEAFTGKAGLSYVFDNGIAPYISYSEGFSPVSGSDSSGNPFDPEEDTQYEAGVKYQPEGMDALFTASVYQITKKNVTTTDPDDTSFKVQTGEARSRGVELSGKFTFLRNWNASLAYAYTETEITKDNDGYTGNDLLSSPEHTASAWLNYVFDKGALDGLSVGAGVRYTGSYYATNANTYEVDAFTLVDLGLQYQVNENIGIGVNATNLFDREYIANCYVSSDYCFAGDGRRVVANLTYNW